MSLNVCYPRTFGLAEAKDIRCVPCRRVTRHWLWMTNDAWYDPTYVWRCGECATGRRPVTNRDLTPEPLHWRLAVQDAIAQVRAETDVTSPAAAARGASESASTSDGARRERPA